MTSLPSLTTATPTGAAPTGTVPMSACDGAEFGSVEAEKRVADVALPD
jgi:hypothetical protein